MITPAYVRMMSRYNRAMNERVYDVCASLGDEARKQDRGAFFGSIHGTLNHLVWADARAVAAFASREAPPADTRTEMHAHFDALRAHRRALDEAIVAIADVLTQPMLDARKTQTSVATGRVRDWPLGALLVHLFNHQTHHRGQLSTLLSQLGLDLGVTDIPWLDVDYGF